MADHRARRQPLSALSAALARGCPGIAPPVKLTLELPHGSLLLMGGETQAHYKHALPATLSGRPLGS